MSKRALNDHPCRPKPCVRQPIAALRRQGSAAGCLPVDDAGDRAALPEHVAGMEVALEPTDNSSAWRLAGLIEEYHAA